MAISLIVLFLTVSAFGGSPLPSSRSHSICPPNAEILAPHSTSCSKYISCAHGAGEERNCQNGSIFNYEMGICTDRNGTQCDLCKFNTKPVRLLPFEGNCTKYIICYGTTRVERECAVGLHFDRRSEMCDQQENVDCENVSDEKPISPTIECRVNDQVEFVPSLDSCGEYSICANGTPTTHNCSDGLIFNIAAKSCSTTGHCLLDYEPECETSGTLLPHLFECRHFFYCDPEEVEPLLQACKLGELFDRKKQKCVAENDAECIDPPDGDLEEWPERLR